MRNPERRKARDEARWQRGDEIPHAGAIIYPAMTCHGWLARWASTGRRIEFPGADYASSVDEAIALVDLWIAVQCDAERFTAMRRAISILSRLESEKA